MPTNVIQVPIDSNILSGSVSNLVPVKDMVRNFGNTEDYIELHITDPAGKLLYSIVPFTNYKVPGNTVPQAGLSVDKVTFDPAVDLANLGLSYGKYYTFYNIFRPKIILGPTKSIIIKEISKDRKELRLYSNNIPSPQLQANTNNFISERGSNPYFKEFYLNFGQNQLITCVNIAFDLGGSKTTVTGSVDNRIITSQLSGPPTVLVKLLNPLPIQYKVNDTLSIVDALANPQAFYVEVTPDPVQIVVPSLRGPNFDLDLDQLRVGPTPYYNFTEVTSFQGTFAPQLQQLLGQLSASNFYINVDYSDYENFVHYSSAARRLEGFKYKLSNIETYTSASASYALGSNPTSLLDAVSFQNKINATIQSFDGWEQHLYFETGSTAWPKYTSNKPYLNYATTSSQGITWYNGNYDSASLYDDNNQNYLLYTLPGYIAENTDNELAFNFVASVGQMFDDVWIHIKAITDLYQAKNSLTQGISKDLVYFALQSMGINAYTDQDGISQFQYLYGIDQNGNYLPQTGSYETLVTASQYQLSGQDQQKGIYKRLYNNLPLLLKSKGTTRFVQYLNTIFGIPSTIMGSLEYGGVDKVTSSFEYEFDRFTYSLKSSGSNAISIPWTYVSQSKVRTTYSDIVPDGIEFRFKASPSYSTTQSLFYSGSNLKLDVLYANTGSNDSIYSGTVGNFGYLQFKLGTTVITSSTIPVFTTGSDSDTSWYNVLVQRRTPNLRIGQTSTSQTYDVYIKNNVWGQVGHTASASLTTATAASNSFWYTQGAITFGGGSYPFSGSLQEVRLWSNYVSESAFDSHVLNPESIEGNFTTSSFNDLAARFPLGNNLFTYNHSLTSSIASVAPDQKIQSWTASFSQFPNENNYTSFTETYYADVANSGYANPVNDKIRIVSGSTYGTQLLPNKSIQAIPDIPLTKDIHLLDASLSPQDEIDRAIIAQFGSTYNLDDIIGNPATGSYNELEPLQYEFFKKFTNKYNYKDYIRLIEFFHNSLFRTLKDFTPARTNLSTGIVIKPHLLERSVVGRPGPTVTDFNNNEVTINTAFLTGSNGGNYSQSLYDITYQGAFGQVTKTSDARDFFTGVLPSASIDAHHTGSNPFTIFDPTNTTPYSTSIWAHEYDALLNNVSGSILSEIRQKIIYESTGSSSNLVQVYEPVQLQDFTYRYERHKRPRYDGSITNSLEYNFFNNNDVDFWGTGSGPFGRSAAIDKNTIKFAYFSEAVATGSQLIAMPERTNLYLKYLVDITGSLTELVQRDYSTIRNNQFYNLYQVQNIFKGQDYYGVSGSVNIALFDNQNPSKQKALDGNKSIWTAGYKFYPIMWKIADTTNLRYNIPTGYSTSVFYNKTNFGKTWNTRLILHYGWAETSIRGTVSWRYPTPGAPTPLPFDLIVTVAIRVIAGSTSFVDVLLPAKKVDGSANFTAEWRHDRGWCIVDNVVIWSVRPASGTDPGFVYEGIEATSSVYLTVDSSDKKIVSCSADMSKYYNADFYFSGSTVVSGSGGGVGNSNVTNALLEQYNTFLPTDYPFILTPGDVVRFDGTKDKTLPTTYFNPNNEYTILSVDTTGSRVTFKLDREVQDAVTSSVNRRIERYVFSKKVEDETNIILNYKKQPGQTSGGIVKNVNLSLAIDDNVANIVSELKGRIFSVVLTQGG